MKLIALFTIAICLASQANAMNRCQIGGKTVYQEQTCPGPERESEIAKERAARSAKEAEQREFNKRADVMAAEAQKERSGTQPNRGISDKHPACAGKDSNACGSLALMVNARGRGCYRVLTVNRPSDSRYDITCEVASNDQSHVDYTIEFGPGNKSYTLR